MFLSDHVADERFITKNNLVHVFQCSPFITLYYGSIGMDRVISESCLKQDNFTKEL